MRFPTVARLVDHAPFADAMSPAEGEPRESADALHTAIEGGDLTAAFASIVTLRAVTSKSPGGLNAVDTACRRTGMTPLLKALEVNQLLVFQFRPILSQFSCLLLSPCVFLFTFLKSTIEGDGLVALLVSLLGAGADRNARAALYDDADAEVLAKRFGKVEYFNAALKLFESDTKDSTSSVGLSSNDLTRS